MRIGRAISNSPLNAWQQEACLFKQCPIKLELCHYLHEKSRGCFSDHKCKICNFNKLKETGARGNAHDSSYLPPLWASARPGTSRTWTSWNGTERSDKDTQTLFST
jgi:hypothetical protein